MSSHFPIRLIPSTATQPVENLQLTTSTSTSGMVLTTTESFSGVASNNEAVVHYPLLTPVQRDQVRELKESLDGFQTLYWTFRGHLERIADALDLDEYDFKDFPGMVEDLKAENERQAEEIRRLQDLVEKLEW